MDSNSLSYNKSNPDIYKDTKEACFAEVIESSMQQWTRLRQGYGGHAKLRPDYCKQGAKDA